MRKLGGMICLMTALMASDAMAQVTGSGTSGTVPVFTSSGSPSTVGNSPITVSGSNVGIGTPALGDRLDVVGNFGLYQNNAYSPFSINVSGMTDTNTYSGIGFTAANPGNLASLTSYIQNYDGSFNWTAGSPSGTVTWMTITGGNVGIDTTGPLGKLDVGSGAGGLIVAGTNLDPNVGYSLNPFANSGKLLVSWNRQGGNGEIDLISNRSAGSVGGFNFYDYTNSGTLTPLMTMQGSGNVGIGTTSPSQRLEVNGTAQIDGSLNVGSAGIVFPSSSTPQTAPWTGVLCGGDYAEAMKAEGEKQKYEPGDVLVLTSENNSDVQKSSEPYSTMVAGVVAIKPGVVGLRAAIAKLSDNAPMAMVGVVPTKVSAENGTIRRGDLLVSASLPGYAMKGTDRNRLVGAVIGEAMGSLDSGTGFIEVLVTLQ